LFLANVSLSTHLHLINKVRAQVEQPFSEKLKRSRQLIRLYARNPQACVSCSFGKDSMTVLFLALQENPKIPVVFENTLIEFPETLVLKRKVVENWALNFVELRPEKGVTFWRLQDRISIERLNRDDGRKHSNICCYHLKEKPFAIWRKTNGVVRSFTGLTACESRHRMFVACMKGMDYYSYRDGCWKVHPLMFWTPQEVWDFIRDNGIPVNEAYAKYGLDRIGCMWCMSHQGWREQVARINPRVYAFMLERYFRQKTL
jgi:3'-phosphoadenosine 5'-phosphosulfate sulfotransferase (PAPS reductase)/FAD synthetase